MLQGKDAAATIAVSDVERAREFYEGTLGLTAIQLDPNLEGPVAKGAVVGKVVASSNGKALAEAPLVAKADVERAGFMLRLWQRVTGVFGK